MGQSIKSEAVVVGDIVLFDSDRTLTGQDGQGFSRAPERTDTPPAGLARRLFEMDPAIDYVFVLSNQVTIRRSGGWNEEDVEAVGAVIRDSFVFYEQNRSA